MCHNNACAAAGLIKHDPFVTAPNALGVVLGVFCAVASHGLAEDQVRVRVHGRHPVTQN
jgi:hypothetical protein